MRIARAGGADGRGLASLWRHGQAATGYGEQQGSTGGAWTDPIANVDVPEACVLLRGQQWGAVTVSGWVISRWPGLGCRGSKQRALTASSSAVEVLPVPGVPVSMMHGFFRVGASAMPVWLASQ